MSVGIGVNKGWLRLQWQYQGKPYSLNLGLQDSPTNRAYAQQVSSRIQFDILGDQFDPTLLKYRPRSLGKNATEINTVELFERFSQHKLKNEGISPRSIETRYKPLLKYLERSLNCKARQVTESKAQHFKALMAENLTPQTAKARLWLLKACWDWAKGQYDLGSDSNPWNGLANGIKVQPTQQIKPFTSAEIQAILGAFRLHPYYALCALCKRCLLFIWCRVSFG
jgi:integrase